MIPSPRHYSIVKDRETQRFPLPVYSLLSAHFANSARLVYRVLAPALLLQTIIMEDKLECPRNPIALPGTHMARFLFPAPTVHSRPTTISAWAPGCYSGLCRRKAGRPRLKFRSSHPEEGYFSRLSIWESVHMPNNSWMANKLATG